MARPEVRKASVRMHQKPVVRGVYRGHRNLTTSGVERKQRNKRNQRKMAPSLVANIHRPGPVGHQSTHRSTALKAPTIWLEIFARAHLVILEKLQNSPHSAGKKPASQKELLKFISSEPQEDRNQSIQLPNSRGHSQKGTPKPRHRLNLPIHPAFAAVEDMNTKKLNETSKFLSYVLRHEPQAIGLQLDIEGWASIDELIDGAAKHGQSIDTPLIQAVVSSSDKKRFSISDDGLRIRAVQGHSTSEVSIQHTEKEPPEFLYHGTATRFLDSIWQQGLVAGSRHHVHLSSDVQTALAVGQRYGTPAILKIEALQMYKGGMKFYQADNGVWLTNHVPPERILKAD